MESTTDNKNQPPYQPRPETEKKIPMFLVATVITLSVVAILLGVLLYRMTTQRNDVKEDLQYVEVEKTNLEKELNGLIVEYDSLKTENDTLNSELEIEQEKIRKLLGINASNATKIQMYKKELETLRQVMRSYIVQIDSLNTKNRELTQENIEVRSQYSNLSANYDELSKQTTELSTTVKLAQKLSAKNILAEGLNKASKLKDKASKVEKIRLCFTVRENAVAEAGNKMIYLRIIRPDKVALSDGANFEFNGQALPYSAKRELEYEKVDIDMCIYWDITEVLTTGEYELVLYCEGYEMGKTTLLLK